MTESNNIVPKEFRIYKPNKSGKGAVSAWQLSYKNDERNRYNPWVLFLAMAQQDGVDNNGNAKFDWDNKIIIKLGDPDIGKIMSVLEGRTERTKIFHQTQKGSKNIEMKEGTNEGSYGLNVSAQDASSREWVRIGQYITADEATFLLTLLRAGVAKMYGWN